jgi:membrane glycosyltransferase
VLRYRRRDHNTGRKPGNIADWVDRHGADYDHMLVLDADSRMAPSRIRTMIWQMERRPRSAFCRPVSRFCPAKTRFGRHQRVAARLLSPGFGRGLRRLDGRQRQLLGPQRDHAGRRLPRRQRLAGSFG